MRTPAAIADDDVRLSPRSLGQEQEGPHSTNPSKPADEQSILIVEDNAGDVYIMEEALREHNVHLETTILSDGEEAASFFDRLDSGAIPACPSLVLLDLNLPKRSGHWVLGRIRAGQRCPSVPVVIVSSSEAPADMEQNRRLGATAYFRKPSSLVDFLKLGTLVNDLLSSS